MSGTDKVPPVKKKRVVRKISLWERSRVIYIRRWILPWQVGHPCWNWRKLRFHRAGRESTHGAGIRLPTRISLSHRHEHMRRLAIWLRHLTAEANARAGTPKDKDSEKEGRETESKPTKIFLESERDERKRDREEFIYAKRWNWPANQGNRFEQNLDYSCSFGVVCAGPHTPAPYPHHLYLLRVFPFSPLRYVYIYVWVPPMLRICVR